MIYESRFSLNGYYRVVGIGEIASDMSKNSAWVNALNEKGETPLHIAARYKKFDILQKMLPYFTRMEACDNHGNTVMHALLDNTIPTKNEKKCSELIDILMSKGGQVNQKNRHGWTPVHLAVRNCQIEVLNVLEKDKIDFNLRVDNGDTLLHLACKNMTSLIDTPTEIEIVNNLIIHGCNVSARNNKGYSILHCAVENCGVRVVEKLIDCGANFNNQTDELQLSPLHLAVQKKNLNIIDALIKSGANVNSISYGGLTPLHLSIIIGSSRIVKMLIDGNADVNFVDEWSALHLAVYLKRKNLLKLLLNKNADVNIRGVNGLTPLHLATILRNFKFVKILVDNDAQVNCRDDNDYTPLHMSIKDFHRPYLSRLIENSIHAYMRDRQFSKHFSQLLNVSPDRAHKAISRFLLSSGADVNARTNDDESPVHFCAETGNVKLLKCMLKYNVELDYQEKHTGFTALHLATYWDHAEVVRELTNAGANLKVTTNDGKSVIHLAAIYNRVAVVKELINGKIDVNATTRDGKCALHLATLHNHVDIVRELLNGEADVNARADDGKSPLHLAVEKDNGKVFKLLFKYGAGVNNDDKRLRNTPLHVAARENNELMIHYLVKFGSKLNATNDDGFTPLHYAVDKCNVKAAAALIEFDADVNCKTKKYQLTPLHLALQRKCYNITEMLVYAAADVNVADSDGVTPLHLAALYDKNLVTKLLCRAADVRCSDKILQFSALHIAVIQKNEDMLNDLIESGADVDVTDKNGLTPLHLATILGSRKFVGILIERGANFNCRDVNMYTPLHFALCNRRAMAKVSAKIFCNDASWISRTMRKTHEFARENYDYLVDFLIELGADLNAVTKQGENLLHFAAEANAVNFIKILMRKDLDVNSKDRRSGMTPLQTAVLNDHKEAVVLLISNGADVNVVTECGKGLLHLATESGGTRVLELLLRHTGNSNKLIVKCPYFSKVKSRVKLESLSGVEFDVNIKDRFGMTPLHLAALHSNRKEATETLLLHGASTNIQDDHGLLPIHYAMKNNRHQQLECLLAFGVDVNDVKVYGKFDFGKIGYETTVGIRMIQHVMKLKALEFPIADVYESILRNVRFTQDNFYKACLEEIDKLRCNFIGKGVSLYNLLHVKRRLGMRIHAKNIEPRVIEKEFPIYYSLILDVYHRIVVRDELMRKAELALYQLTDIDLPIVCTEKIFHYLEIVSLLTLIKAAEISGKDDNTSRTLCVQTKIVDRTLFQNVIYFLIYKVFNACELLKCLALAFVCAAVFLLSIVPTILYSMFNKWT